MKSLISGATGYLGASLTRHLASIGDEVHAVVRRSSDTSALNDIAVACVWDGSPDSLDSIVSQVKPDRVFHLAADQSTDSSASSVERLVSANILLGTHLARACSAVGVRAFVSAATHWQYGRGAQYSPTTLYAATKQAFADILAYFVLHEGLPALSLELPNTYGPDDPRRKLLTILCDAMASGRIVGLTPGDQVLDLVHVDDVAKGFVAAAELVESDVSHQGKTYALHSDDPTTLKALIPLLEAAFERTAPVKLGALQYRDTEIMGPTQTPRLPNWAPKVSLRQGIEQLAASAARSDYLEG